MDYRVHGYRHADYLYENLEEYSREWNEILDSIEAISDKMIIEEFEGEKREAKSISQAINRLMKAELTKRGWNAEATFSQMRNMPSKQKAPGGLTSQRAI